MPLNILDSRVDVYHPETDLAGAMPDFTVPGGGGPDADLVAVDGGLRLSNRKDQGTILALNDDGQYSQSDGRPRIHSGDRLDFFVRHEDEDQPSRRWVVMVRDVERTRGGPNSSSIELTVEDYAMSIMSKRKVYNSFDRVQIAGSPESILNTVLRNEAPAIDRSLISNADREATSVNCDGTNLLELSQTLARRAGAHMRSEGTGLRFAVPREYPTYAPDKRTIGGVQNKTTDGGMVNEIRVHGGRGRAVDEEQPNQSGYTTVAPGSPIMFQVSSRKTTLDRIQLWLHKQNEDGNMNVRIQKGNEANTGPIEPDDVDSDIDSHTLNHEFLDNDGFTPFDFGDHSLPDPDPWIIVEAEGEGDPSQELGVDADGNLTYIAEFGYPVRVRKSESDSINRYRTREGTKRRKDSPTEIEALALANEVLNHESAPENKVKFEAVEPEAHYYFPGDRLTLNYQREGAVGEFMITERSDKYDGMSLETDYTAQEIGTI
jgi:hypothetical protein